MRSVPARPAAQPTSLTAVLALVAGTAALALPVATPAAVAAPPSASEPKITICHRTHSLTNPYRKITVALSAADTNGASTQGGGHADHKGPVWTPATTKATVWGDVIPPNPTNAKSTGYNWNG